MFLGYFDAWQSMLNRRSRRVVRFELDEGNGGEAFPDIVAYVEHDHIPGQRVVRYRLAHNGHLEGGADASQNLGLFLTEATDKQWCQFALSETGEAQLARGEINRPTDT